MFEHFGSKFALDHYAQRFLCAQGFWCYLLQWAYAEKEEIFNETLRFVPKSEVDSTANIISPHVLYKIKADEYKLFKLGQRTAPHWNADRLKHELRSECPTHAHMNDRVLASSGVLQ